MSRADELRRRADLLERYDEIAAEYEAALEAYRTDPSEELKAAYREAAAALQEWRAVDRADRASAAVDGDAFASVEG